MDREYFQHAIQEATNSLAVVTTNVIGCATTGVFVLYMLSTLPVASSESVMEFLNGFIDGLQR
jgi:hypothetical protein